MAKLNQVIAVEPTIKSKAERVLTDVHRVLGKPELLTGLSRVYAPKDEDGEVQPPQYKLPQVKVTEAIDIAAAELTRLFDVTLTKESANTEARADVAVNGVPLLSDVPVTYLLFLEKQLVNVRTFVEKLPTLDPAVRWTWDANQGLYVSEVVRTASTKKVRKNWVKAEATREHPAQVEVFTEDDTVGHWSTTSFSGAIPATRKQALIERVDALVLAVKRAREAANDMEVAQKRAGEEVFTFLFGA